MTQRPLDAIVIEGFKSIARTRLELRSLNVLIGANGSGKSNLIAALGMVNEIVARRLQSYVGRKKASRLLHHGPKRTTSIRFRLEFGANAYEAVLGLTEDDGLFFERESAEFHDKAYPGPYPLALGSGHRETGLFDDVGKVKGGIRRDVATAMRSWRIYHFHDTSDRAAVKQTQLIADNEALRADAGNLASFLHRLREKEDASYLRIVAAVRQVAPFFDDFRLRADPLKPDSIKLEWSERDSDAYFDAHSLSDGTLRFICLATLLLQPAPLRPSLVIVDEPELGLHPYAVTQLAAMLQSTAEETQVLVATQSVTLMNQFQPKDVVVVDREAGASIFRRLTDEEVRSWTDDYALGELWEKNVLGGRPRRG